MTGIQTDKQTGNGKDMHRLSRPLISFSREKSAETESLHVKKRQTEDRFDLIKAQTGEEGSDQERRRTGAATRRVNAGSTKAAEEGWARKRLRLMRFSPKERLENLKAG